MNLKRFFVINLIEASFVAAAVDVAVISRYNLLLDEKNIARTHCAPCTCTKKCEHTPQVIHSTIYVRDDLLLRLPLFLLADFDDSVVGIPCTPTQSTPTNSTNITEVFFMLLRDFKLLNKKKETATAKYELRR